MALTATTLISDVTAPVNYVLMRGLLSAAKRTFPYYSGTLPGTLEKNQGSLSVKWRRVNNLDPVITALSEPAGTIAFGVGRTAVQATITDLTVASAKYGNAILMTEEVDLINVNSRAAQLLETLGENAGHSLNLLMRNVYNAETTKRFASGAASVTVVAAAITVNDIKYTVNQLNNQSAMKFFSEGNGSTNVGTSPIRSSYFGIAHVDVEEDIRALTGFIPVENYGGYTDTEDGEFGAIGGVRWSATEVAPIETDIATTSTNGLRGTSATLNSVYSTFIYGREAVGSVGLGEQHTKEIYMGGDRIPAVQLIQKAVGSSGVGDMFDEIGSLAWKSWFAGKVLNSLWVGKIQTAASDLS